MRAIVRVHAQMREGSGGGEDSKKSERRQERVAGSVRRYWARLPQPTEKPLPASIALLPVQGNG